MAAIIYLDIAKMPDEDGNVCVHSFTVNPLATDNKWKDNYEVAGPTDIAQLKGQSYAVLRKELNCRMVLKSLSSLRTNLSRKTATVLSHGKDKNPLRTQTCGRSSKHCARNENGRYHSARKASCLSMYMRIPVHTFRT